MGTPVPPPPVLPIPSPIGNPCTTCWGTGKPFGDGDTPVLMTAKVSGINKGPFWDPSAGEPPNGAITLTQTASPCFYRLITAEHTYLLTWTSVLSRFTIELPSSQLVFAGTVLSICENFFLNVIGFQFIGGSVQVRIRRVP